LRVLVDPGLNELFLVRIEPVGLDVANLFEILRQIALFKLLYALVKCLFI